MGVPVSDGVLFVHDNACRFVVFGRNGTETAVCVNSE